MACQDEGIPEHIKSPLNMGSDSHPSHSNILTDIKEEIEEYVISIDIKEQHGIFTSDTKSLQPAVIKIENDDEFSEFEFKYNEEEQYMTCKEETSSSGNVENRPVLEDIGGPSSSYELKHREVDLDLTKMDEVEDTTTESTEGKCNESGEEYSAQKVVRFTHMRTRGKKYEDTFECIKCEKMLSSKLSLENHIVKHHGNNGKMMNSVTSKIRRCKQCRYITVYVNNFTQHMRIHGEKFVCTRFEIDFSSKLSLDGHIIAHHINNGKAMSSVTSTIYRCKYCSYITVHAICLAQHMATHQETPKKPFTV